LIASSHGFAWLAPALIGSAVLAACDGTPDAPPPATAPEAVVRDSAGVRIVENGPTGASAWTVDAEPLFTVGWDADGPLWSWTQSGRILSDGGALIGEFSQGTVYRLGPDGGVVETWGGQGQGPDEYQGFDSIILHGDSVLVSDARLGRVTIRDPDEGIRTIQLPRGPHPRRRGPAGAG